MQLVDAACLGSMDVSSIIGMQRFWHAKCWGGIRLQGQLSDLNLWHLNQPTLPRC